MKKIMLVVMAFALLTLPGRSAIDPHKVKPVKNIILMITDGTSLSTVSLSRWLQFYQDPSKPNLNIDPYLCGTVRTNCSDAPIGDSAPTTSCYMTGHASRSGYICTYPPDKGKDNIDPVDATKTYGPMATLLEAGKQLQGKSSGLVVTCQFPHATPADCSAHYYDREAYDILAEQQVHNSLDVVIGGGNDYLTKENEDFLKKHGYTVLHNDIAGMRSCKNDKMWALYAKSDMAYEIDRDTTKEPSLAEDTKIAIDKLSKNKKGFFLMVEGSKVDWAAHANDPAAIGPEFLAFDKACRVALDFAKKDGNTAVIILPDHGNSGLSIGCARCSDYSHRTKDELFGPIVKFKLSVDALGHKLNTEPYENLKSIFSQYEGINLSQEEVDLITHAKGYEKSPIPQDQRKELTDKPLYSPSFSGLLSKILTDHTYLGWTTGGHTGEEVFLACYNPNGIIPLGMNTNVELSHYLQALFGLYGKMDQFTDKIFTHHDIAFKGYDYKIEKPSEKGQYPKLIVKNKANGKIMTIEAFTNIATLSGAENKVIEISSVMPYVDRTGKFYVPSDMAQYLK